LVSLSTRISKKKEIFFFFTSLADQQGVGVELIHVVNESAMGCEIFLGFACRMGAGMGLGLLGATLGGAASHANGWWWMRGKYELGEASAHSFLGQSGSEIMGRCSRPAGRNRTLAPVMVIELPDWML
jgi:hypothetical protein